MKFGGELFEWPAPKTIKKSLIDILESIPDKRYFLSKHLRDQRHAQHKAKTRPRVWHQNKAGEISSHEYSGALRANANFNYLLVDGERRLTPREQLRLQGFPDSFTIIGSDADVRKQAGTPFLCHWRAR